MRAGLLLLAMVSAAAIPRAAFGQQPRRVAVVVLRTGSVGPAAADTLTEVIVGAVAQRGGAEIIGKEEFQAQLGQSEEQSLQCIDSPACLGRVGVQLNVTEVVGGTVGQRSPTEWVLNVNRIEIAQNRVVGRLFLEVRGALGDVVTTLRGSVDQLYRPPVEPATVRISSTVPGARAYFDDSPAGEVPLTRENVAPGRHRVRVERSGYEPFTQWVVVSSGSSVEVVAALGHADTTSAGAQAAFWGGLGLLVIGGASGAYFALQATQAPPAGTQRQTSLFLDGLQTNVVLAEIAFIAAGVGALTSLSFLLFGFDSVFSGGAAGPTERVSLVPAVGPGFAFVQAVARW